MSSAGDRLEPEKLLPNIQAGECVHTHVILWKYFAVFTLKIIPMKRKNTLQPSANQNPF